jgi:hypothetical protein
LQIQGLLCFFKAHADVEPLKASFCKNGVAWEKKQLGAFWIVHFGGFRWFEELQILLVRVIGEFGLIFTVSLQLFCFY